MQAILDDAVVGPDFEGFQACLDAAREAADAGGRVIVDVAIDGEPIEEGVLFDPARYPVSGEVARFTSEDKAALVDEALGAAAEALTLSLSDHRNAGELIQAGKVQEGKEPVAAAFDAWQTAITAAVQACSLYVVDAADVTLGEDGQGLGARVDLLVGELKSLSEAVQKGDWVTVGDLVMYDLAEKCEEWAGILPGLGEHIRMTSERQA